MLDRLRQIVPAVSWLICFALLATWITGAHGHRHAAGSVHKQVLHSWFDAPDHAHDHAHAHEGLSDSHTDTTEWLGTGQSGSEHFEAHSIALIHADGHENIEILALQPQTIKTTVDLPSLVLLYSAVLFLTDRTELVVHHVTDPPDERRADWFLRPLLRGPPTRSVALI